MPTGLSRRAVLANACSLPVLAGLAGLAQAQAGNGLRFGPPQPFSFERLKAEAKRLAAGPYGDPPPRAASVLDRIDFDDHGAIRFKDDHTLWPEAGGPYPVQFFHPGKWFKSPIK